MDAKEIKRLYNRLLKRALLKLPPDEAEDITQKTVCEAWEHREQLRDERYYNGWTAAILKKHIAEYYRQRGRRVKFFEMPKEKWRRLMSELERDRPLFTVNQSSANYWALINRDEFVGLAASTQPEDFEVIWKDLVAGLPPHYIEILRLYILDGYTMPEIAEMLGCSYTGAWSLYRRAAARLREVYVRD